MESHEHIEITSAIAADSTIAEHVAHFGERISAAVEHEVGITAVPLDGRFHTVRTQETNLGNFVADMLRHSLNTCPEVFVDVAFFNSGSLRSDKIHPAGRLKLKDILQILPYMDEVTVVLMPGSRLRQVLENAVSMYPKFEGRFLQVRSPPARA